MRGCLTTIICWSGTYLSSLIPQTAFRLLFHPRSRASEITSKCRRITEERKVHTTNQQHQGSQRKRAFLNQGKDHYKHTFTQQTDKSMKRKKLQVINIHSEQNTMHVLEEVMGKIRANSSKKKTKHVPLGLAL